MAHPALTRRYRVRIDHDGDRGEERLLDLAGEWTEQEVYDLVADDFAGDPLLAGIVVEALAAYQPDPAGDCTQCGRHGTVTHPGGYCLPTHTHPTPPAGYRGHWRPDRSADAACLACRPRVLSLDEAVAEALAQVDLAVRDIRADHPGINDGNAYHTAYTAVAMDLPTPVAAALRRRLGL
jgi:hypothetical protein